MKITDTRLTELVNAARTHLDDDTVIVGTVTTGDLRDMVSEIMFYRNQISDQKTEELADIAARAGLTGKIEKCARALASTTARYGKSVPERQTIAMPYTVFLILERGFKAIRDADELSMARVIKNLIELPQPDDLERYIMAGKGQDPNDPKEPIQ